MGLLRKVRALSRKWFSKRARKLTRKLGSKAPRTSSTRSVHHGVSARPPIPQYRPRSGDYDLSSSHEGRVTDALEQLGRGAISTFGNDIQALLGEGKDVLKSLHGDFFSERGYEAGEASRSAFKTFYDVGGSGTYSGLNRSQAWGPDEDAFSYSLRQRTTEILDVLVSKDTLPPAQLQARMTQLNREAQTLSSRGAFGTIGDPYIRRPGVGLIVDIIAQADREIVIDLYQLQNRTVLDALEQKVRDNPGIKLSVRLSLPDSATQGQKGFDILGPNLLSLERLRRVKESLGSRGDIELFVQDRKSHQKVMVTDKFGIIGSLNLTAPVGGDVNQAGSNYEVVRRLQTREYSEEQYRNQGMTPTPDEEVLISSSDKLFRQLQESVGNRDALRKDPTSQLKLNQGQVVGAAETYEHLRSTLDLMKDGSNKQFYGILNQVFLLYHEDTMFNEMLHGEMGKFDSPSSVRGPIMKGIQTELLDLVIDNRAFLAIDNRNYAEHVLTPMYERTEAIFKGTGLPTNSLEELVGHVGFDRSNPVTSFMARVEEAMGSEALARGFNESYARQVLAMTSGNIRLTTVPMQHSKQYLVVESAVNGSTQSSVGDLLRAQSFYSGSANPGAFSMHAPEWGMDPREVERTNREFGLAFLLGKTGQGKNALTQEELAAELALSRKAFSDDWTTLTRTPLGNVEGRPTSAWYEDKVDKAKLRELHTRLSELTTSLGVGEVSYTYGGRSGTERTGLSLTMDARKLAGFGEGFERVLGKGPTFRWDYTTLSGGMGADEGYVLDITRGRLISRSLIHNSSASNLNIRVEDISQGIGQDVLLGRAEALDKKYVSVAPNKAAIMSPVGTTLSLVSTLLLESMNRLLVWGPEQYLSQLEEGEKRTLVEKYLDTFTPGSTLMEEAAREDRSNITNLMDTLERRLTGDVDGALKKVRAWTPSESRDREALQPVVDSIKPLLSSMAYGYSMQEHLDHKLEGLTLDEARAIVPDKDMVARRVNRAGQYIHAPGGLIDILVPLLDTNPEFRLAVVQATVAQSNASYTEILTSGINAMSGALMEPFLLSAQVSQYSGGQGWYRLPMFGATDAYQEVLRNLEGTPFEVVASQALAIPRLKSPYSSTGIPGMHHNVAGGTNNEGTSIDTGLTLYGQRGTPVATVMHHGIASSMGVGFSTRREDILASRLSDGAKERALVVFDQAQSKELLTYLFGGVGKVAQIPQRLKNTQGQRGMGTISYTLAEAMSGRGDFLSIARDYHKDLRSRLEEKLLRSSKKLTPNQVGQYIDRIMPEQDTVLAAAFSMSVRGVMSGEGVAIMEAYERALMEMGLEPQDFEEGEIGHELVRVRAISSDVMSTGMKGFTASPTYALVQMAGMYSDYFYANPSHGGMEGNLRMTTKKVKASMLGVDWTRADGGGMELARARDIVMFDTTLQKVIVVNHINGTTKNYGLADLATQDLETLKETIDDRGQRSVLEGMIENKGREGGRSSVSTITATGWVRPGEDSREYLLSMKALPGGGRNQLFYELTYVQALTPGGGRRVDSGTSLFKGVAVFLTSSYFEGIARDRASRPDMVLGNISAQETFGLINPSNLKSFSLEHGGSLLRGGKAEQVLASLSEREAAVAMLLAFGSNYMEAPDKPALSSALYDAMREMPGVYKETALQIGLREGPQVGASKLLTSLDKSWNPASMYSLMDISSDTMLSSLRGGEGIKSTLSELLSKGTKSSKYLNVDDPYERQAATILTALDITRQLLRDERVTPGDVSMRPDVMEQLMSIVGLSEVPEEAIARAMISGLSQSVASIYLKMDLSYSSSKEPIGTKGTGALQNADLVRPFTQIGKEFSEGGDLSKLRVVLANMLVSTAVTETATAMIKHILPGDALPIRSVLDPHLFTPLSMSRNLGIYGSGMEDIMPMKKVYQEYGVVVQAAIEERLVTIASGSGDIRAVGAELSTLLFDAADPSSNDNVRALLGTQWKHEYGTSLSSIQDVGRRYELMASKPFAVGEAEAIASQMAHERGVFHLPAIVFDPMPSESGRIVARIDDYSPGTSFFIPGAEDLRTYGIQYGSYTDELVRSTLTLASAFSPGTVVGNIFSTLSKVKAAGGGYVEFTPEEVKAIQEYYVTAYSITERIAEASAGTRLKLEMRTRGFVSTAAASFGIPQGMFLAPDQGMQEGGDVRDSLRRQRLEEVTSALSGTDVSKSAMKLPSVAVRDLPSVAERRLLTAEREALMSGMGEKGTNLLRVINEDLEYVFRNPSLQREYAAARLWTTQDAQHISTLMEKVSSVGTVEAVRLLQEVKDYTRKRIGSETVPTNTGVRSYRDIVGPRQGNEGNYYSVELGEQLMRSALGVREEVIERMVNPPTLSSWLRSKGSRSSESIIRGMNDQYLTSGPRVEYSSTPDFIQPYLIGSDLPVVGALKPNVPSVEGLPVLGKLSRVVQEGALFTGKYEDIKVKKGTLTRLRELEESIARGPRHLEYQRRSLDRDYQNAKYDLQRAERRYEYTRDKLYGYNREGMGLVERVTQLERTLASGKTPYDYRERQLQQEVRTWEWELRDIDKEEKKLEAQVRGVSQAMQGKEVEVDREWAHWYEGASLETPIGHVEGVNEVLTRQLKALSEVGKRLKKASNRLDIYSSLNAEQLSDAQEVWGPWKVQEGLRNTNPEYMDRYRATLSYLDTAIDNLGNQRSEEKANLIGTKKNIQGEVRLGSSEFGYAWFKSTDSISSLEASRKKLELLNDRIMYSLIASEIKTERLMGYLPSNEDLAKLSNSRKVAEGNLVTARTTLQDPSLQNQKEAWRREREEQLAQARTLKGEAEAKLSSLGVDLVTLRANKDRAYTRYVEGLEKYEVDKKTWVEQRQGKLDRLREIVKRQEEGLAQNGTLISEWEALEPRREDIRSYKVGGEYYSMREQAEVAQSALDSNLRGQLSNAIDAYKVGQYQGSSRGRVETYRIDRSLFVGLGMAEGRELLADSVSRAKGSVDQLLAHLSKVDDAYGYGPEEKALISSSRMELETLSSELGTLHSTRHDWTSLEAPIARMETLQVSLNTSDVLQATVFRSAPFGSSEIQRLQFGVIGIGELNQYLAGQGMEQLDEARNKSLGLLPALSAMTTTLNDFDGDPYTVIFSKIGSAMNDRQRLEDKVRANTLRMGMIRREAAASGGEYLDDYFLSIEDYKAANSAISTRISRIDMDMRTLRDGLVETYDPLLRKEVASYLGISQSFFNEYQQGSPITMEVLPTYLQQGRGLFGGIEGVAHKNNLLAMHATMEQIHATEDFQGTLKAIRGGASMTEALSPYGIDASNMLQGVSDDRYRKLLTEDPDLRSDFLEKMITSIQASPTLDPSASLMHGAAQLSSSEGAISSYSKYMGMGSGASMSPTVYDMLTKTLGVAGSDILGKSYNALVGTLFRDSPLIALSHVLSSNTAMEGMKDYYRGTGYTDEGIEGQIESVHEEARRAESLQGFMKSAQQLLRDSIKFKGDTNVLGELQRGHAEYEKYLALGDEASARTVLNDMAGKLGPSTGPGLRSYMQLNTLVESSDRSVYTSPLSSVTSEDMSFLSREYKIDSPESITRLTQEMRDRGYQEEPLVGDVVRYKVARDMRATITAFRYELGSTDNQPFLETVWRGMRSFLGVSDREQGIEDRFKADPSLAHDIGAALSADANDWWGKASSKNKALMLALVDEGRKQTDPIFGQVGEELSAFVSLEVLRKKATALGSGRTDSISGIPTDLVEADVTIAILNAAMGDKMSPEYAASTMGVMVDYLASMGAGSKMKDVLEQSSGGHTFVGMDHDDEGRVWRVINTPGGGTRMDLDGEELRPGESYRPLVIDGQEYASPLDWVKSALEATSTGSRSAALEAMGKGLSEQLTSGGKFAWADTVQNALGASISEDTVRMRVFTEIRDVKMQQGMPAQEATHQAMEEARDPIRMEETRARMGAEMRDASAPLISQALRAQAVGIKRASLTNTNVGGSQASHVRHSQEMHEAVGRMHDMNDMLLGAGLTLIGSLMATGSINENTIGQVVGGTVSILGYSQMGRPGVQSVLGQGFRARMAHAESKGSSDEGEWVRRWVGREVGFYMGAAVLAPALMGGAEKLLSRFSPLRLDRPMDLDKYKNWKAAANTLGGAVLSSVLGMITSVVGGEVAVHGTNLIPSLGVVENFVRSMADTESRRQDMIAERLAQVGEGTVMDAEGDPMRAAIEVSYVMDNPTTDFTAYPMGESDYSEGDDWEVNVVG